MTCEHDGTDDIRLTLDSEFAELEVDYGCSLEQSINEGYSSAHFSTSEEAEAFHTIPLSVGTSVPIEGTAENAKVKHVIDQFIATTCKCQLGPSKQPCSISFSKEAIQRCRNQCAELSHNELDLIVMAQVHYMRVIAPSRLSQQSSFRLVSTYCIHGIKVCQSTFLFMHNISRNRYIRITSLYNDEGLTTSVHRNTGRVPINTFSKDQVEAVKQFIENY